MSLRESVSPLAYQVHSERNAMVPMRDGVRLATDVHRPARNGQPLDEPLPVLLHRTPYNKSVEARVLEASFFASRRATWTSSAAIMSIPLPPGVAITALPSRALEASNLLSRRSVAFDFFKRTATNLSPTRRAIAGSRNGSAALSLTVSGASDGGRTRKRIGRDDFCAAATAASLSSVHLTES